MLVRYGKQSRGKCFKKIKIKWFFTWDALQLDDSHISYTKYYQPVSSGFSLQAAWHLTKKYYIIQKNNSLSSCLNFTSAQSHKYLRFAASHILFIIRL